MIFADVIGSYRKQLGMLTQESKTVWSLFMTES